MVLGVPTLALEDPLILPERTAVLTAQDCPSSQAFPVSHLFFQQLHGVESTMSLSSSVLQMSTSGLESSAGAAPFQPL